MVCRLLLVVSFDRSMRGGVEVRWNNYISWIVADLKGASVWRRKANVTLREVVSVKGYVRFEAVEAIRVHNSDVVVH